MLDLKSFAREVVSALDEHLSKRGVVSQLAAGAAFEAWLAFEARLVMEHSRARFGLDRRRDGAESRPWLVNERRKVDLFIGEDDGCLIPIEFKLVFNNKNWATQVEGIAADLMPAKGSKKAGLKPMLGRVAIVGLVGKTYGDSTGYPGMRADLTRWEAEVWEKLRRETRRKRLYAAVGHRHRLNHEWLEGARSFFQLHAFTQP
ncbi:MAG: hypothetical protein JNJ54_04620 [Myxococcaceae bacterium]|nr:hypothetical protein [Myxococcaceae bacterium]